VDTPKKNRMDLASKNIMSSGLFYQKEKGKRIYVAGALSSKQDRTRNPSKVVTDYIQNLHRMCKTASELRKLGYYPYIPGLDFLLGLVDGEWEEDDYRGIGFAFLEVCDAMLIISESWGVTQELARAKQLGIPVFYGIESLIAPKGE